MIESGKINEKTSEKTNLIKIPV
jgi:hypothetical protein